MSQKILIVEDEDALRRNLEIFLGEFGHRVCCAACGKDAVRLLHHEQFDIVITDIHLGDMDGLDLVSRIMSQPSLTSVLVMTAYRSVDSIIEVLRKGADDYILKPFLLEDFGRKVENAARQRQNLTLRRKTQAHHDT